MQSKEYTLPFGGKTLTAQFTDLADQAHGSVILKYGETVVLVTAVISPEAKESAGYFPLSVDYEEKFYATGRILGSRYMKREGRPSDEAILTGRVVDRTIRPLFDAHIRNEVHVVVTVLSIDTENDPDILGIIGASLALGTSEIPWNGPVSAVRIGQSSDQALTINPSYLARETDAFDLLVCGKDDNISMIEAEAKEAPESRMAEAFALAVSEIEKVQKWQTEIIKERGKAKRSIPKPELSREVVEFFTQTITPKLDAAIFSGAGKDGIHALEDEWMTLVKEKFPDVNKSDALDYCAEAVNDYLHKEAVEKKRRADARKLDEVRPLIAKVGGLSSVVHGSGTFYRGGTHILSILTLASPKDSQLIEGMEVRAKKYFMHHYNFPPFSSGETGKMGGTNRRAIGHGALAEKALRGVIPPRETFPYTIRLVSESMASNGSTSMGSVCGSTLALMDGGVPIKNPVAGIAMGVMFGEKGDYTVLTDIQGPEDEHGDMDFKVAGTKDGITAIQLDIKVGSIPVPVLVEAMEGARKARLHILETILAAIPAPRTELNLSAPRIIQVKIPVEKIGAVIGSGGKVINGIIEETGADVEIEEDGTVYITGTTDAATKAKTIVEAITHEYRVGERFEGEVVKVLDFGIVVQIGYDKEGLVHVSEIAPFRIDTVEGHFTIGEKVPVVIREIDPERGKISLSIKGADPEYATRKGFTASTTMPYNGNTYGREQGHTGGPRHDGGRRPYRPRS